MTRRSNLSTGNDPAGTPGTLGLDGDFNYRGGVQKNTLRNLKRGRLHIYASLDLHGFTRSNTGSAVKNFTSECVGTEERCVLLVTGKGRSSPGRQSIVRATALEKLRQDDSVLAYCCALPQDGGYGAFYVLLRAARKRSDSFD